MWLTTMLTLFLPLALSSACRRGTEYVRRFTWKSNLGSDQQLQVKLKCKCVRENNFTLLLYRRHSEKAKLWIYFKRNWQFTPREVHVKQTGMGETEVMITWNVKTWSHLVWQQEYDLQSTMAKDGRSKEDSLWDEF